MARRVESHHRHRDAARARARARCPARREVDFSARTFRAVWSFSFGSDGADFDGDDSHTAGWAANHDVYQSDGGSIVPLETTGRLLVTFGGLGTGAGIKSVTVVVKRGDRSATKGSLRVVTREILVSVRFL